MTAKEKIKEKLVKLIGSTPCVGFSSRAAVEHVANWLVQNGVTVQECIPVTDVQWLGEDIAKLCIRYITEYADFRGYASQKKVKAHIIRLLQAEADGRIAIMPQPPKGE